MQRVSEIDTVYFGLNAYITIYCKQSALFVKLLNSTKSVKASISYIMRKKRQTTFNFYERHQTDTSLVVLSILSYVNIREGYFPISGKARLTINCVL